MKDGLNHRERDVSMEDGSIQVSAPNVEEAVERGLVRLGLTREEVSIEIVDQGSRGILGLGARDAIVRLRPVPPSHRQEPKQDSQPELEDVEPLEQAEPEMETEAYAWSQERIVETARQTLSELLTKMGIECRVVVRKEDVTESEPEPITLDVVGEDLKVLIGRQGEVLNALQYITRLVVSREVEHWVNLVVDVERYKQRRAKSLRQLAKRIADRVARTKQPVALEPMPPNERRVIHITLRDHPAVITQSVGKGEKRKVTIIPKR
jgi:spoIIIJ-associated protein